MHSFLISLALLLLIFAGMLIVACLAAWMVIRFLESLEREGYDAGECSPTLRDESAVSTAPEARRTDR